MSTGRFRNPWPNTSPHGLRDFLKWVSRRRVRRSTEAATVPIGAVVPSIASPRAADAEIVVTWIGHSSFLLQIGSINVLLDPIWSERASPISFIGPKRIAPPGLEFAALPPIDLVLITHDHYDHLDRPSVKRIIAAYPGATWVAPLEVGRWLRERGASVVAELDWWQSVRTHALDITCTPAQHFSGRWPNNRDSTLWCGWVIRDGDRAVFFSGDTGRHPEFESIASRLGPFDAAFLPIGAYEPRWFMGPVHMAPDDAVAAYTEIVAANDGRRCTFVAMHWGTFRLTDEPVDEPLKLTRQEWKSAALAPELLWIPARGETRRL